MNKTELNIRQSLLSTLTFLASEYQQLDFAAQVQYASYQGEFSCWWFDTFFPEEPEATRMFSSRQLSILTGFSEHFNRSLAELPSAPFSIQQLLATPQWKSVIAKAQEAMREVQGDA